MASDSALQELFPIEGILVASRVGQVRLLVDQLVMDLDESDVVSVSELPFPPGLEETVAQPVRLELRRGVRLLGVGAAEAYEDVLWKRGHLFAMRTRRGEPTWQIGDGYQQLERRFLARYGIVIADEAEAKP
jgi:hypothetical protein